MPRADPSFELLVVEVARGMGLADAGQIAAALREGLGIPGAERPPLVEVLAQTADWDAETLARVRSEAERIVEEAGGSARRALIRRGGPTSSTRPRPTPAAFERPRNPTSVKAREALREIAPERYSEFEAVGEGGMGIVYWAVDNELNRQVAFKIVRPPDEEAHPGVTPPAPFGLMPPGDTETHQLLFEHLCARFLQEAWVTGGMEHPGIPPVYELGRTASGVPYYTMRFIRGSRTLATAIGELKHGDFEARLALLESFLKVLDTVRYAHRRGVIHRDLKPENIALGDFGEVVVIDWGLARLVDNQVSRSSVWQGSVQAMRDADDLTTRAAAVGTPGFIPPEALDDPEGGWTERGDLYSLGVILFEILTGRLPLEFSSLAEFATRVRSEDAPDPRTINEAVPAPLAALCLGMLARDPTRRPAGADAVAAAIRAWQAQQRADREAETLLLGAEVVLSQAGQVKGAALLRQLDQAAAACRRARELRPEDERAKAVARRIEAERRRGQAERDRLARRQVLRRTAVAAVAVLLVGGAVVVWMLESRRREAEEARVEADTARAQAESDRARAETVMSHMVGPLKDRLDPLGRLDLLTDLSELSRVYYESLPLEGSSTESLHNRTVALRNLGEVHALRGDLSKAIRAYDIAQDVAERLVARDPDDVRAAYHRSLAEALLGRALLDQGRSPGALAIFEKHLAFVEKLADAAPENDEYALALVRALDHLAVGLRAANRPEEATEAAERALAVARPRGLTGDDHRDAAWREQEMRAQLRAGGTLAVRRMWKAAEARGQVALDLAGAAAAARPDEARWRVIQATAHGLLGIAVSKYGDAVGSEPWSRALEHYRRAEALLTALVNRDKENLRLADSRASATRRRGDALRALGHGGEAQACYREVIAGLEFLVEHDESNARWAHELITLCDRVSLRSEDAGERVRLRARAVALSEELLRRDPTNLSYRHLRLFTLVSLAAELPAAERGRAISILERGLTEGAELLAADPKSPNLVVLLDQVSRRLPAIYPALGAPERSVGVLERNVARIAKARREMPSEAQLPPAQRDALLALAGQYESAGASGRQDAIRTYRAVLVLLDEMDADETLHSTIRVQNKTRRSATHTALERLED